MAGSGYAGGSILGGLGDLVEQFRTSGQGRKAESWVSAGQNEPIDDREMEQALGPTCSRGSPSRRASAARNCCGGSPRRCPRPWTS
jgi:hypothetical protein